jgi:hypothetical protein
MFRHFAREGGIRRLKKPKFDTFNTWKVVRGDEVVLLAGEDKGKRGKVLKVMRDTNRVVVEGLNKVRRRARS